MRLFFGGRVHLASLVLLGQTDLCSFGLQYLAYELGLFFDQFDVLTVGDLRARLLRGLQGSLSEFVTAGDKQELLVEVDLAVTA